MTTFLLYVLLWLMDHRNFDAITQNNKRKLDAQRFYTHQQYLKAAEQYRQITYSSIFSEPGARLNMAHAYFLAKKYTLAMPQYQLLTRVEDKSIASTAYQQLALIQVNQKDTATALTSLKEALQIEPSNEEARYNFILLKKSFSGLAQIPKAQNDKKNNEQQTKTPNQTQSTHAEVEETANRMQLLQNLKAMNMSEAQARAILDAMKSNESQYIYQLRRKQYAQKAERNEQIEW